MRSGEIVEALPVFELFLEIEVIFVGEKLVELLLLLC
jgi:hypothetical protein